MSPRRLDPSVVGRRLRVISELLDDLTAVPSEADMSSDRMYLDIDLDRVAAAIPLARDVHRR